MIRQSKSKLLRGEPEYSTVTGKPDYKKHQIYSKRNLEDFTRFWICFGGLQNMITTGTTQLNLLDAITSGSIQVGLKWKTVVSGTPTINIYPSKDGKGSTSYLTDPDAAQAQISDDTFNCAVTDKNGLKSVASSGTFVFKSDYWTGLANDNPKKCLLFEGAGEGKGELKLVFLDKDGKEMGTGGSLWMNLLNIKKMYVRGKGTPEEGIATPWSDENPSPTDFVSDPNGNPFDQPPDEEKNVIVFVHGIHPPGTTQATAYNGCIATAETVFKRLWHSGYKGRFAFYKWPAMTPAASVSSNFGFDFNQSEYRAWKYGQGLTNFVSSMPSDYAIRILAHSQGNAVVGGAFRSYKLSAKTWISTNGAIPLSCFDSNIANYIYQYTTPDLATSLGYRGYLETGVSALVINFDNQSDHVTGWVWNTNQQLFKPNYDIPSSSQYIYDSILDQVSLFENILVLVRKVTDNHESMAMAVQSRSVAIGQGYTAQGIVKYDAHIDDAYGFGDSHSAQWDLGIQKTLPYYQHILDIVNGQE